MTAKGWMVMGLASMMNFLSGCGESNMNNDVTNFKWYAVATAPRDYPMEVIRGTFYFPGGGGIDIPSGGTLTQGWGKSSSGSSRDGTTPLPDRLEVTFYSYAENQFYKADVALPYDDILAKFQQYPGDTPDESDFDNFLLGIAPGGAISVWIQSSRTIEVFYGQAEKLEISPTAAFALPFTSKADSDEYVESALAESVTPEQLVYIKTQGPPVGAWERFRQLYHWVPTYKAGKGPTRPKMPALFLNGESYSIPTQFSEEYAKTPKPLPSRLQFRAQAAPDNIPLYIIDFEPFELLAAAEKLSAYGGKIYIEFDVEFPTENTKIRLYNDREPEKPNEERDMIELKKFSVEPWEW
jgi:hypothetical protein